MSHSFDENGKYVGWSPLFDFTTLETLKESEKLPIPDGTKIVLKDSLNSLDLTEDIDNIINSNYSVNSYASLLQKISDMDADKIEVMYNGENIDNYEYVIKQLNKHTQHNIAPNMVNDAYKNMVAANIENIISDLSNMDSAYSPIEMKEPRDASVGQESELRSNWNPLNVYSLQVENMIGRDVIGVAAVGVKVFFALCHYYNECVKSGNNEWVKNAIFKNVLTRIDGRADGNPHEKLRNIIANINFEDSSGKFEQAIENVLRQQKPGEDTEMLLKAELESMGMTGDQSLVISALLSAATDNAKELILAKINSGKDLAGLYIHMIIMGAKFKDIASFMTSPAVRTITDLCKENLFDKVDSKMYLRTAIKTVNNGYKIGRYLPTNLDADGNSEAQAFKNYFSKLLGCKLNKVEEEAYKVALELARNNLEFTPENLLIRYFNKINSIKEEISLKAMIQYFFNVKLNNETYKDGLSFEEFKNYLMDESSRVKHLKTLNAQIKEANKDKETNKQELKALYIQSNRFKRHFNNLSNRLSRTDAARYFFNTSSLAYEINTKINADIAKRGVTYEEASKDFFADVYQLEKVKSDADETTALGGLLNNQGFETDPTQFLLKTLSIEGSLVRREKEALVLDKSGKFLREESIAKLMAEKSEFYNESEIREIFAIADKFEINEGRFDFDKFLSDGAYKEATIKYYNLIKASFNIFDIIDKLPHYNANYSVMNLINHVNTDLILKTKLAKEILRKYLESNNYNRYIKDYQISSLFEYVDKLLIRNWLAQKAIKIELPSNSLVFKSDGTKFVNESEKSITLSNDEDLATFKMYVENVLTPKLQAGINPLTNLVDPKLSNNSFIRDLHKNSNKKGNAIVTYLKLPMNLQFRDTSIEETQYQQYVTDLSSLSNIKFNNELTLQDIFMLYNVIVNKNQYGADRFTGLFKSTIQTGEKTLLTEFLEYTGKLDSLQDLKIPYSLRGVFLAMAAKTKRSEEFMASSPIIKVFNSNTQAFEYKENIGTSYRLLDVLPKTTSSKEEKLEIENDYTNYFILSDPMDLIENNKFDELSQINLLPKRLDKIEKWKNLLDEFTRKGILLTNIKCN